MLQIPRWHKTSETLQRGTVEILQAQTLKVRSLAAWRITSQSVRMMRPASFRCSMFTMQVVSNWYRKKILHDTNFHNSCHLKGLAVQIEALHCKNPKIRYAHKPFCFLCRIQRRHWTHTCYSRKRQKVASGVSQLDFFKTVLFCGDCCNRHSVHCANYSK